MTSEDGPTVLRVYGHPTRQPGDDRCRPTFLTRFPRGATFRIDCPNQPTDSNVLGSNNAKDGTSAAHCPTHPEHSNSCCRKADVPKLKTKNF
jgi:hypothetical protein